MSNPTFPTLRKFYAGIKNPLFLSDIQVADQSVLDAITALSGLTNTDFFIVSGLAFTAGTPNFYTPGIVFFNGSFYNLSGNINEGLYLSCTTLDVLPETFDTTPPQTNNIYTNYIATPTSVASGNTPLFAGNMNQYRISNKYLQQQVAALLVIASHLGTAANANLGTGIGQVLTADQTYTQTQVNALLMTRSPSVVGSKVEVYDPTGAILAFFDGTGLGITYPWKNGTEVWAIANGNNSVPNMGGVSTVGIGVFTNPDSTTQTFVNNVVGGETHHTLIASEIPVLATDPDFAVTGGGTLQAYATVNTSTTKGSVPVNTGGGSAHNNMPPFLPMFIIIRKS